MGQQSWFPIGKMSTTFGPTFLCFRPPLLVLSPISSENLMNTPPSQSLRNWNCDLKGGLHDTLCSFPACNAQPLPTVKITVKKKFWSINTQKSKWPKKIFISMWQDLSLLYQYSYSLCCSLLNEIIQCVSNVSKKLLIDGLPGESETLQMELNTHHYIIESFTREIRSIKLFDLCEKLAHCKNKWLFGNTFWHHPDGTQ